MALMPKGPTPKVLAGVMAAAVIYTAWHIFVWQFAVIATVVAIYEAWTFVNKYENDSLSEGMWWLSARPLVPFAFGLACAWAIESHLIADTHAGVWSAFFVGGLCAHFFFESQAVYEKQREEDLKILRALVPERQFELPEDGKPVIVESVR